MAKKIIVIGSGFGGLAASLRLKAKGYDVTLVSTDETGNSTSSIKNYIENAYYSWDNPPEYLCLVGDADGSVSVPTYDVSAGAGSGGAHGESDYPYTLIEGDDYYPWQRNIYNPELIVKDGKVQIPEGPGWGVEINSNFLEQKTVSLKKY